MLRLLLIGILLLSLQGCVVTSFGTKEAVGDAILFSMQQGREKFCGGVFPLASYEKFLRANGLTWSDYHDWCNRNNPGLLNYTF